MKQKKLKEYVYTRNKTVKWFLTALTLEVVGLFIFLLLEEFSETLSILFLLLSLIPWFPTIYWFIKLLKVGTLQTEYDNMRSSQLISDNALESKNNKYARLNGINKRKVMLTDMKKEYDQNTRAVGIAMLAIGRGQMSSEKSWGASAGFANAIGGPGAAISVAMDIENQNAQIRARNAAIEQQTHSQVSSFIRSSLDGESKLSSEINKCDNKRVDYVLSTNEIFKYLNISTSKAKITSIGSFIVSAKVSLNPKMEGVLRNGTISLKGKEYKSVVDGTIYAEIFQNDQSIGIAYLPLPALGIGAECELSGIIVRDLFKEEIDYTYSKIVYHAKELWFVEE